MVFLYLNLIIIIFTFNEIYVMLGYFSNQIINTTPLTMLYEISLYKVTTIIQRNLSGISSISQEVTLIASKGFSGVLRSGIQTVKISYDSCGKKDIQRILLDSVNEFDFLKGLRKFFPL